MKQEKLEVVQTNTVSKGQLTTVKSWISQGDGEKNFSSEQCNAVNTCIKIQRNKDGEDHQM